MTTECQQIPYEATRQPLQTFPEKLPCPIHAIMCLTGPDARRWDGTIAMDNEENNGQGYRAVHFGRAWGSRVHPGQPGVLTWGPAPQTNSVVVYFCCCCCYCCYVRLSLHCPDCPRTQYVDQAPDFQIFSVSEGGLELLILLRPPVTGKECRGSSILSSH